MNEEHIKVSVLIPVYGVEKYIEKCVKSLFEQTIQEGIEFIFVDDATPDNSISIIERTLLDYPQRINQVRIIHNKKNLGLADTRVVALKAARGEYVIHCDSDDWVDVTMYEKLYQEALLSNADIVGCNSIHVFKKGETVNKENFLLPKNILLSKLIKRKGVIDGYLWNRLIRRDFYIRHMFKARSRTTLFEDMAVTVPMHALSDKVAYVNESLYYYRRTDDSTMSAELSEGNIRSAVGVLMDLFNTPSLQNWQSEIQYRMRSMLFNRLYPVNKEKAVAWMNVEYKLIKEFGVPLLLNDKIRINLIERGYFRTHNLYQWTSSLFRFQYWKYLFERVMKKSRNIK
ncbi:MAG: glycosyltransferase family 2 protein [Bacteroides sp.]|nr:glycosyltransferase family 2 protein [Bacteroides sp.]